MAINFLNTVDLNKNQLNNAAIQNLTSDPATGVLGQVYFNTVDEALKICVTASTLGPPTTNAVWVEVGATSGVETFTNANGTYVANSIVNTSAIGNVSTGTIDLTAVDGTSSAASRFLTKDNKWATIPFGDITDVNGGTYITTSNSGGPVVTVNHDLTTRTDTTSILSAVSFPVVDSVTTNSTGHVTAVNVKTVTVPDVTTYDLTTAPTGTAVRLTGNLTGVDDVTISGTTGQTATSRISASELRVKLTDSVTIIDDLTVGNAGTGGELTVLGTGQSSFAGQVTIPLVPVVDADAASKRYVDQSNIGQSVFQGGYDANTNTPDLDVSPATDIKKGWFWAVTVGGTFFSEVVQPGDLIYADVDNPGATFSNWVVVQSGQDIATDNTQALAIRGISAYDSTYFNVDATGWATLRPQANPYAQKIALTGGVDSGGETTFTVNIVTMFGVSALAANCIATVKETASSLIVYPEVTGNGTGSLDFNFIPVVSTSAGFYTAYITYI
jgi:hypothetical protein